MCSSLPRLWDKCCELKDANRLATLMTFQRMEGWDYLALIQVSGTFKCELNV